MSTQNFKQVIVYCTDLNKDAKADVVSRTDQTIKVVFVGSTSTMTLHRMDVRRPYVGNAMGMEFSTTGKELS